jgi:hypothetical protein
MMCMWACVSVLLRLARALYSTNLYYVLHTVFYIPYTIHYILHTTYYIVYTILYYIPYTLYCILYILLTHSMLG